MKTADRDLETEIGTISSSKTPKRKKKTKKKTKTNRYENENKIKDRKKKKHSAFIDLGGVFVDQIEKKRWTNCDAADGEFQVEKLFSNPDTESTLKKK